MSERSHVRSSDCRLDTSGDSPQQVCQECEAEVGELHEPGCRRDPEQSAGPGDEDPVQQTPDCHLLMRTDDEGAVEFMSWVHGPDCPHHGQGANLGGDDLSRFTVRVVQSEGGPIPKGYGILYDEDDVPVTICELGDPVNFGDEDDAGLGE